MDTNGRRSTPPGGEQSMGTADWRTQLQPDSRQRIVNKIMDTLKRHLLFSGPEGLNELQKIAGKLEEKIYTTATSQSDYLRRISLKMLSMESKSNYATNSGSTSNDPPDPGSGMQNQVRNQGQSHSFPLSANQPQQLLSPNIQNNMASAGVQGSSGFPIVVGQNSNMQNISGVSQNVLGSSVGQGVPCNLFANSQRMQERQQVLPQQQQQQQQQQQSSQIPQQYLYQQQLQQQLMKQKLHQGNLSHQLMMQQQQQQHNLVQPNQLQSSQQSGMQTSSVMQPSMMQQNQLSSVQQSTQPMIQQHSQSVLRPQQQPQSVGVHQHQTPITQQTMIVPQQLVSQQSLSSMHHQQLGPQNVLGLLQQQQQQQQLQLYQSQRALPETSSTSLDSTAQTGHASGGDWQEEVYQKIKVMKELYLPELNEMYQKILTKLQQHDSFPQPSKSEQFDKLKIFKNMLERIIGFLQVSKHNISPVFKDKLGSYEKQIMNFISTNRPRKPSSMQQGQLPPPHMHSMQQQQPQTQISQVQQSHDNQMNPQMQSMNRQSSAQQPTQPVIAAEAPSFTCPICIGPVKEASTTECGHIFCKECIETAMAMQRKCPTCRQKVGKRGIIRIYL